MQLASEYALNDKLEGSGLIFQGKSALYEMAKEPRNMRKILAKKIIGIALNNFSNKKYLFADFALLDCEQLTDKTKENFKELANKNLC